MHGKVVVQYLNISALTELINDTIYQKIPMKASAYQQQLFTRQKEQGPVRRVTLLNSKPESCVKRSLNWLQVI